MILDAEFNEVNHNLSANFKETNVVSNGTPIAVDQTYNPESENAQSGKAVAEGIETNNKSYVNQTFTNALKGSKSGTSIAITDISPIEHELDVQLSSDIITDFSSVNVSKSGKNLIELVDVVGKTNYQVTCNIKDGVISLKGDFPKIAAESRVFYRGYTATGDNYISLQSVMKSTAFRLPKGTYTFSVNEEIAEGANSTPLSIVYGNIGEKQKGNCTISSGKKTFTTTEDYYANFFITLAGVNYKDVTFKPQLEIGSTATDFELYTEPQTVTANADGTVKGLRSISPKMLLSTDTEGTVLNLEYNRDINIAFAELEQAIISLGGNI